MKLVSIEKVGKKKVFDITVKDQHHYIIGNGIITHNSGGGGLKYAASIIVFLRKSKKREGADNEITGAIIKAKVDKSRLTVEYKEVETLLDHQAGIHKYYGLIDIAVAHGVVKRISKKVEFPGGVSAFESVVYKNPEKYFTEEVLDLIDVAAGKEFLYGSAQEPTSKTEA